MNSFLWLPTITGAESIFRPVTYLAVIFVCVQGVRALGIYIRNNSR